MEIFQTEQLDAELAQDCFDDFGEKLVSSESLIIELEQHPSHDTSLRSLFRTIHSIKGNLGLTGYAPLVPVLQELEDILDLVRQGDLTFNPKIGDLTLLLLDHVRRFLDDSLVSSTVEYDSELYKKVGGAIKEIADHHEPEKQLLTAISLLDPQTKLDSLEISESFTVDYPELAYFSGLLPAIETRMPKWQGRVPRLIALCERMNQLDGNECDIEQIAAALYTHDIAMSFLPKSLLISEKSISENEYNHVKRHVYACSFLLSQSDHWELAAQILLEHHERVDGGGYPKGLSENDICEGAKCIAVAHAYEAITHGHYYETQHKRPIMRAVMEISANAGNQFSEKWVRHLMKAVQVH
jgi:HD-GYP domain-containing protein (c-di-GMP phosphodiesterase class II)